jgi:hypothetical protein
MAPHRSWPLTLALAALAASPLRGAEIDPHLPPDTTMVVSVNVRQILDSDLVKGLGLDQVKGFLENTEGAGDILKDLGLDPLKDINRVVIASPGGGERDRGLAIVHGKFDVDKFAKKAEELGKEEDGEVTVKVHKVPDGSGGRFAVYEVVLQEGETSLYVALASKNLLVASAGKDYVVDALKRAKAKKKPALKNKDFQALLEKMDGKQSVYLAALGEALKGDPEEGSSLLRAALEKVEAIGGGITFGKDLKFQLVVASKTDKDAKALRTMADRRLKLGALALALLGGENKRLNALVDVVRSVRVSGKGKVVTFKGKADSDTIKELLGKEDD